MVGYFDARISINFVRYIITRDKQIQYNKNIRKRSDEFGFHRLLKNWKENGS